MRVNYKPSGDREVRLRGAHSPMSSAATTQPHRLSTVGAAERIEVIDLVRGLPSTGCCWRT